MSKIKTIGILTSGGDAPGMNAAIRAVTRAGICNGFNIKGIYRGYDGLIKGEVKDFTTEDVSGIITRGGTILKTARSKEFMTPEGMQKAYETCQKEEIDALVVIGGNGSLTGAWNFGVEFDFPCIGLPGTIDNDLYGTDATIGYDTTMNTIMDCVDRIRDTANSHERIFFVEVMGRDAGFLAQNCAIACGAEAAIVPEEALTSTSWPLLWVAASASQKSHVSLSFRRVRSVVPSTMPNVSRTNSPNSTCAFPFLAISSAAEPPQLAIAYWPAARASVLSKPLFRASATSWWVSATMK